MSSRIVSLIRSTALGFLLASPLTAQAPVFRTFSMRNGMQVTLIRTGSVRKAVIKLVLRTGEMDEPAFGPGLASLTAQMLLQGTLARSAQQIADEATTLGTKLIVGAGPISTSLSGEVDAARIPRLLTLISDLVRHPLLDSAGFSRVRSHAISALDSTLSNPGDLAKQSWRAIIFPNGPFGHPYAFAATLGMLQLGHVRNVYDDGYSASRAHLYVSGSFDDIAAEQSVREVFSDWKAGAPAVPLTIRPATVHELVTLDRPGSERSVVWIGLPTIDPADRDFPKLEVADMLVSGGDSSLASLDLASIDGVQAHGGSTLWQRRGASYWVDVIDVHAANTGAALGAVLAELERWRKQSPPESDVARARDALVAAFKARSNSREGMLSIAEFMDEHSLGEGWRTGYTARVQAVTPEDVRSALVAYLDPRRMAIAVVGDQKMIEPQLEKLRPAIP